MSSRTLLGNFPQCPLVVLHQVRGPDFQKDMCMHVCVRAWVRMGVCWGWGRRE